MFFTIGNISLSGCFLHSETPFDIGTSISLSIMMAAGEFLRLGGRVARRHHSDSTGYGISFEDDSEEQKKALSLLIAEANE